MARTQDDPQSQSPLLHRGKLEYLRAPLKAPNQLRRVVYRYSRVYPKLPRARLPRRDFDGRI